MSAASVRGHVLRAYRRTLSRALVGDCQRSSVIVSARLRALRVIQIACLRAQRVTQSACPRALRVIQSAPDLCTQTRRLSAKDLLSDSVVLRGVPPNAEAPSAEILRAHSA